MSLRRRLLSVAGTLFAALLLALLGSTPANAGDACVAWPDMRNALVMAANNQAPTSAGGYGDTGGYIPHVILFSMAATESVWTQLDQSKPCNSSPPQPYPSSAAAGWGLLQITFGRVDADRYLLYNAGHGASILNSYWSAPFGYALGTANAPQINNAARDEIEDWFFALWNYNGAACRNGQVDGNNPRANVVGHYMNWSPSLGTRVGYTYEDVVYYFMQNPPSDTWSAIAPGGLYYPQLYVGYFGNPGQGFPDYNTFNSDTWNCPTGYRATTRAIDYGYRFAFFSQSFPSPQAVGFGYSAQLQIKNVGNNVWYPTGAGAVHLGTTNLYENGTWIAGQDHASPFATASWLGSNRPATISESVVLPERSGLGGSVGTFTFTMCPGCVNAANRGSTYKEYFDAVVDGTMWLPDIGVYAQVLVQ